MALETEFKLAGPVLKGGKQTVATWVIIFGWAGCGLYAFSTIFALMAEKGSRTATITQDDGEDNHGIELEGEIAGYES